MFNKILPENHFFLTAQNDIRNICSDKLRSMGISYFNYLRVYNDGSSSFLCTHNDMIKYLFANNVPVAAPVDNQFVTTKFNYMILPIGKYNKLLHHAKLNWDLSHFIDLVDRYEDYFELFCFGSTPNNSGIVNFYLNNMDYLEKFKIYFKEKAFDLLKKVEKNKILLPNGMEPPYRGINFKSEENAQITHEVNKDFYLKSKYGNVILTKRQYDCLSQLAAGCTAKEAAKNLGISHRTFENYLATLKSKIGCHKKSQLITRFLNQYFLIPYKNDI